MKFLEKLSQTEKVLLGVLAVVTAMLLPSELLIKPKTESIDELKAVKEETDKLLNEQTTINTNLQNIYDEGVEMTKTFVSENQEVLTEFGGYLPQDYILTLLDDFIPYDENNKTTFVIDYIEFETKSENIVETIQAQEAENVDENGNPIEETVPVSSEENPTEEAVPVSSEENSTEEEFQGEAVKTNYGLGIYEDAVANRIIVNLQFTSTYEDVVKYVDNINNHSNKFFVEYVSMTPTTIAEAHPVIDFNTEDPYGGLESYNTDYGTRYRYEDEGYVQGYINISFLEMPILTHFKKVDESLFLEETTEETVRVPVKPYVDFIDPEIIPYASTDVDGGDDDDDDDDDYGVNPDGSVDK